MPLKILKVASVLTKARIEVQEGKKVVSHIGFSPQGQRLKLVVVLGGGHFSFTSEEAETVTITSGTCVVKVTGWKKEIEYRSGMSFHVRAKTKFVIQTQPGEDLDYFSICD